jgi:hypothetical protein
MTEYRSQNGLSKEAPVRGLLRTSSPWADAVDKLISRVPQDRQNLQSGYRTMPPSNGSLEWITGLPMYVVNLAIH